MIFISSPSKSALFFHQHTGRIRTSFDQMETMLSQTIQMHLLKVFNMQYLESQLIVKETVLATQKEEVEKLEHENHSYEGNRYCSYL